MKTFSGKVVAFAFVLVSVMSLALSFTTPAYATNGLRRLSGATRLDTMSAIADEVSSFEDEEIVDHGAIICSASNYPDALVASSTSYSTPIILTEPDHLSNQARKQLQKIKPSFVSIIGGEKAVSSSVSDEVKSIIRESYKEKWEKYGDGGEMPSNYIPEGMIVHRYSGQTRYETAKALLDSNYNISQKTGEEISSWGDTAIIASGEGFADALSASSLTQNLRAPIVLANPTSGLTDGILSSLKKWGFSKALVIGGEKALSKTVETQLSRIGIVSERLSGATRYETSIAIAKYGFTHTYMNYQEQQQPILNMSHPIFATGSNFPDALAASSLSHCVNSPIILVDGDGTSAVELCSQYKSEIKGGYIIGGTKAISNTLASTLASACGLALS